MSHIAAAESDITGDEGKNGDRPQYDQPSRQLFLRWQVSQTCLGRGMLSRNPVLDMEKNSPAICVFCGSSYGNNPVFREAARRVGSGIAEAGFSMVFGGGSNGLMGDVAAAAAAGGAPVQGIIPAFLQALEGESPVSAEEKLIVTPHMQERKALMLQMSDAFLVLPGGLGTFDEFFEVATEAQLGVHRKPIIVVNVDGYFDALDAMLRSTVEKGFAKPLILELYHLANGPEAALLALKEALAVLS
jgi:hypothetical protein